ncbi:MAG: dUTP diphosphatase [Bacilli bacterium]|nr:dUTP diphosphatase [Bacilli bacterium]
MAKIELEKLFEAQAKLDQTIADNHHVTYESTRERRILSLIVEIGELANATRCFKYWSNKGPEPKDIVLDEYADGLHFFLSLGLDIRTSKKSYNRTKHCDNLTSQFHEIYHRIDIFKKKQDDVSYIKAFQSFLNLLPLLGYRWNSLEEAYYKKLGVNYNRQETNY